MPRDFDPYAMSELEREFEFEMDEPGERGPGALEADFEALFEADEPAQEYAYEFEGAPDEGDEEFEALDDSVSEYAERFFELSQREFESESEVDSAINGLLTEMEPEYFFGTIKKAFSKARGAIRQVSRSPIGGLIRKGIAAAGGQIPAFAALKGITSLARGDLRGLLAQLAKSGLGAALPGAGVVLPTAMKAMGFEAGVDPEENREAWNTYVQVSREAYEHLANNLTERADDPLEASRLASAAFQQALRSTARPQERQPRSVGPRGGRRVVYVRPGDELVIRVRRD